METRINLHFLFRIFWKIRLIFALNLDGTLASDQTTHQLSSDLDSSILIGTEVCDISFCPHHSEKSTEKNQNSDIAREISKAAQTLSGNSVFV